MTMPEPEESTAQGGRWHSIWGVLVSPGKTFEALASRPSWLPALLLLVATAIGLSAIVTPKLDMRQVIRDTIEERGANLSEAQIEQQVEMAETLKWAGTFSQIVIQPLVYLIMAGVFLIVFRLMGSDLDFKQSLSVSVHGMMPFAVATALTAPIVFSREELSMQEVQNSRFLFSNLAAFAPEEASKALTALLSSVDLFSIWALILLAIGFQIVGRVSKGTAFGVVLGLWTVAVAGKVALAALF